MLEIDYQVISGENEDDKVYVVRQIAFTDFNSLQRFGEFFAVMNGLDQYYLFDIDAELNQRVNMDFPEEYDKEEFVDEDNKEVMVEDRVDTDQIKNIG